MKSKTYRYKVANNANIAIAETGLDTRTFRKAAARVKNSVEIRQLWRTF